MQDGMLEHQARKTTVERVRIQVNTIDFLHFNFLNYV